MSCNCNKYEQGGTIEKTRTFNEFEFNKLVDRDKKEFFGFWSGYLWDITHKSSSDIVGKFNPKTKVLYIFGNSDLSNPLVKWLQDNSKVSREEYQKLFDGGRIKGYNQIKYDAKDWDIYYSMEKSDEYYGKRTFDDIVIVDSDGNEVDYMSLPNSETGIIHGMIEEDIENNYYVNGGGVGEIKFEELVGNKFSIKRGSGTKTTTWEKEDLLEEIKGVIKHELFDRDFYYNWTDEGREYSNIFDKYTLNPMLKDIDKTLNEYFVMKKYPNNHTLEFKEQNQGYIDNWFKINSHISPTIRNDYKRYREKYAGITPYAKGGGVGNKNFSPRMLQKMAYKQAKSDIAKHYYKTGDPFYEHKPSDEWRKWALPYDTIIETDKPFKNGGYIGEISKTELETMVGRKLDGWNDDEVVFEGKVFKKCYLRPYYIKK